MQFGVEFRSKIEKKPIRMNRGLPTKIIIIVDVILVFTN